MEIISSLIKSFVLTLVIELIIVKSVFFKRKIFVPVLLVNMLTNPLVVYIYNMINILGFAYKYTFLIILELLVVLAEGYVYKHILDISWRKALLVSLIANAIAYLTGLWLETAINC